MDLRLTPDLIEIRERSRHFCDEWLVPFESETELLALLPEAFARFAASSGPGDKGCAAKTAIAAQLREKVWPLLDSGEVKPILHATFPLEDARAAHELMESSAHLGKIVLVTGK